MRREWSFPYQWFYNCPGLKKTQRAIRKWPGHIAEAGRWLLALENKEGWHGLQANRYYLRYDGWLNSSSLLKVIKTCPSSAYVCKVLIALGTYEGNWCFSRFFVFWQIVENSIFFFRFFFLKFVCTRSSKEFLRTSLNVSVRFRSNWNLEVLVNMKRGKPEYPEKKLLKQRKEPTTNSTHI